MDTLKGKIAIVAGATRGAGRGTACMLGERGATVYCTGRSIRGHSAMANRPESIEETAELVTSYGGVGIPVQADHTVEAQVKALFERVESEQGRLDILVNDIWGGDELMEAKPFWESSIEKGLLMLQRAIHTHLITSRYGAPLMVKQRGGLIIEVTDGVTSDYRGMLFYDLAKSSAIRLAFGMSEELRPHNVTALAITPGFLRSEAMLDYFGVTEDNWRDGAMQDPHFIASETPFYVGKAIASLASDSNVFEKTGGAYTSWDLAEEYGFVDADGSKPHWGRHYEEHVQHK